MDYFLKLIHIVYCIAVCQASYCHTSACTTGVSLYLSVCCAINNLGQTFTIKGNGITRYILCPKLQSKSCLSGIELLM